MSVVRRDTIRRWSLVGSAVAMLCLLPVLIAVWPSPRVVVDSGRLWALILASTDRPYVGYVDSRGEIGLPNLPALDEVAGLLGRSTRIRVSRSTANCIGSSQPRRPRSKRSTGQRRGAT